MSVLVCRVSVCLSVCLPACLPPASCLSRTRPLGRRFRKLLQRVLDKREVYDAVVASGLPEADKITPYAFRKGSLKKLATLVTYGVSATAVEFRAGWKQPKVKRAYLAPGEDQDGIVGRILAGLPVQTANFAWLPPHFSDPTAEAVTSAVAHVFPHIASRMAGVAHMLLASMVYNYDTVIMRLPEEHWLRGTIVADSNGISGLKEAVRCEVPREGAEDWLLPTGILPHTDVMMSLNSIKEQIKHMGPVPLASPGTAAGTL